jgi:hypothetical protein
MDLALSGKMRLSTPRNLLVAKPGRGCLNLYGIETGVLHDVGLRNTLEPDPDNTGVGSFGSEAVFLFESWRELSCFIRLKTRGIYARSRIPNHLLDLKINLRIS